MDSKDGDVIGLAEPSSLFGDSLSGLGTDLTRTLETEELACDALGFNDTVGEQA